jgi:hypothetical protein
MLRIIETTAWIAGNIKSQRYRLTMLFCAKGGSICSEFLERCAAGRHKLLIGMPKSKHYRPKVGQYAPKSLNFNVEIAADLTQNAQKSYS